MNQCDSLYFLVIYVTVLQENSGSFSPSNWKMHLDTKREHNAKATGKGSGWPAQMCFARTFEVCKDKK